MKRFLIPGLLASLMSTLSYTNAHSGNLVPLCEGFSPDKIKVDDGAPNGAKRISGIFNGKWANQLEHTLVVERISADGSVKAFYAWGQYAPWGADKAACVQAPGIYQDGVLTVRLSQDRSSKYALSPSGILAGEYYFRDNLTIGTFQEVDLQKSPPNFTAPAPEKLTFPSGYESELVATDLMEDGKPVRLQLVTLKPEGPGPFPLLVFNHGSTGRGDVPAAAGAVHLPNPIAQHFLEKGWMIVSPQRRGRGWSEGLYDEGFVKDRSRYSWVPHVTLAGFDRALADIDAAVRVLLARDDVDARQVIMGGQSRGGILSLAYSERYPGRIRGVLNFVGGWLSTWHDTFATVHQTILADAAKADTPTLWLYGRKDQLYGISDIRPFFDGFKEAGGVGEFVSFPNAGHGLMGETTLWKQPVDHFMQELGFPEFSR
ncbi:alpha/beta fold hydrolase [Nisaea sp.]|uniref:alpha/beta hydrolase family protein n=1 Tax=Nisaea sp. TaxID=2024842 RepID=UPI00329A767E